MHVSADKEPLERICATGNQNLVVNFRRLSMVEKPTLSWSYVIFHKTRIL